MNKNKQYNIKRNLIGQFVIKIDALEHIDYINVKVEPTICEFFKIIGVVPNFLKSFSKNLEDIHVPRFAIYKNKELLKTTFYNFREYCLLLLATSYIIEHDDFENVNVDIFNKYVIKKYLDDFVTTYKWDIDINYIEEIGDVDITQYSNINIRESDNVILVMPHIKYAFDIQTKIVSEFKKFSMAIKMNYHCNFSPSIIINLNKKHFNINVNEMPERMFLLSENMDKIIAYPQEADINWFYSIIKNKNKCPAFMHKYMMKLKSMLKYDDAINDDKIDFYDYVKTYNVPKQKQDIILSIDRYSALVNIYGDIIDCPKYWSFGGITRLSFFNRDYIELDQHIIKENNKLNLDINHEKIQKLFEICNITYDKREWIFAKLMEIDFSTMNIHYAMDFYTSQLTKVEPIIVTKSFCSLILNKKQKISILKRFLDYNYDICIDENNNWICAYEERMIFDGESIPTNTIIIFDMLYCLLCKKVANNTEISIGNSYIKKKRKYIRQPYFCKKCIKCAENIRYGKNYPSIDLYSHRMHFKSSIIEMMDIIKNNTTIILGFKNDNDCTLKYLIYDIIKVIIAYYVNSIDF